MRKVYQLENVFGVTILGVYFSCNERHSVSSFIAVIMVLDLRQESYDGVR